LGLAGSCSHSVLGRLWRVRAPKTQPGGGYWASRARALAALLSARSVVNGAAWRRGPIATGWPVPERAARPADYRGPLHVVVRACRARWDEVIVSPCPRVLVSPVPPCPPRTRAPVPPCPSGPASFPEHSALCALHVVRPVHCALWPLVGRQGRSQQQGLKAGRLRGGGLVLPGLTLVLPWSYLVLPWSCLGLTLV
jgi:hypothetical protein